MTRGSKMWPWMVLLAGGLLAWAAFTPTVDGQAGQRESSGFGDQSYSVEEGGEVNVSFHLRPEGFSYRNVSWFVYLAEPPARGPLGPENASLLLPVRGPLESPDGRWTNFTFDLHPPQGLTGRFVMGMTWDATWVDADGESREVSPGQAGGAAAYALEIHPRPTNGGGGISGPSVVGTVLVAVAGALLLRRSR